MILPNTPMERGGPTTRWRWTSPAGSSRDDVGARRRPGHRDGAGAVAERIRRRVAETEFAAADGSVRLRGSPSASASRCSRQRTDSAEDLVAQRRRRPVQGETRRQEPGRDLRLARDAQGAARTDDTQEIRRAGRPGGRVSDAIRRHEPQGKSDTALTSRAHTAEVLARRGGHRRDAGPLERGTLDGGLRPRRRRLSCLLGQGRRYAGPGRRERRTASEPRHPPPGAGRRGDRATTSTIPTSRPAELAALRSAGSARAWTCRC